MASSIPMDAIAQQAEFFAFPVIEEEAKAKSTLRRYLDATEKHGPLVNVAMAAAAMKLHRSRIYQFIDEGRLPVIDIGDGKQWLPAIALEMFWTENRPSGRPSLNRRLVQVAAVLK